MFLEYFSLNLQSNQFKQDFINSARYKKKESAWIGDKSIDDRLQKILPNHYLDLTKMEVRRTPLYPCRNCTDEGSIIEIASSILKGTFTALSNRFELIQPLTAGWDTRILLAASKELKDHILYYTFDTASNFIASDMRVAANLARKLGLNFKQIQTDRLSDEFLQIYNKEHIFPRVLPKTATIQYHYYNYRDSRSININGNGGEIARCYYGYTRRKVPLEMLHLFSGYPSSIEFARQELSTWAADARQFAEEHGIPLLDLFYWEQRMGNWGANYPFEQDIAIEEISPFNNKCLLSALLKIRASQRRAPHHRFMGRLIQYLWPDVLSEPINPDKTLLNKLLSSTSYGRFYLAQAKRFMKKLIT
jgi:hypothetical protein